MFCKKIKYEDYNGNEREEEFYFNLNKAEITRMLLTDSDATLDQLFEYFQQTRNGKEMLKMVEDLIQGSYGVKSADGKSFLKTPELVQAFVQSEAYSELLMEFMTNPESTAEFFIGIVPKDIKDVLAKFYKNHPDMNPDDVKAFADEQKRLAAAHGA